MRASAVQQTVDIALALTQDGRAQGASRPRGNVPPSVRELAGWFDTHLWVSSGTLRAQHMKRSEIPAWRGVTVGIDMVRRQLVVIVWWPAPSFWAPQGCQGFQQPFRALKGRKVPGVVRDVARLIRAAEKDGLPWKHKPTDSRLWAELARQGFRAL